VKSQLKKDAAIRYAEEFWKKKDAAIREARAGLIPSEETDARPDITNDDNIFSYGGILKGLKKAVRGRQTKTYYSVKREGGLWWVLTPSGKTIVMHHKTRREARLTANVFNHQNRDESTVITNSNWITRMRPIFVVVNGGVAEVDESTLPSGVEVQIIDYDNLKEGGAAELAKYSRAAQAYIKANR
jgi:hypothetical protein